ncbi:MAG: tetratricopeptide repeat protein [Candidatus Eisenbacteria bacterium]
MARKPKRKGKGPAPTSPSSLWLPAVILLAAVAVAYIPAIRAGYIWDDARYVTENEALRSAGGLARIWFDVGATIQYYPMVFSTFWVEQRLWGLHPLGYHLVNVLLHGGSAILLWMILRRLSLPGAWLAAALFALHPVQVESVAWITERKNVLSGFFYLAAMLAWVGWARPDKPAAGARGDRRLYTAALAFFVFALFSKTVTSSLPAAALLVLYWKRGRITLKDGAPLLPFFAAGIAMGTLTGWMEKNVVGAVGADWDYSFVERLLVAGRALWFYLGKLLVPVNLAFNYPMWTIDEGSVVAWTMPAAAVLAGALLFAYRNRIGRGPLVAALFFGGTLFPALGFIDVYPMRYSFVADHFQYLACIGPFALVAAAAATRLAGAGRRLPAGETPGGIYAIGAAIVIVLGALTWRQAVPYENIITLWQDTLKKNPASFLAHNNMATHLVDWGRLDDAIRHLSDAVRLKPDFYEARCGLGTALTEKGRTAEARFQLEAGRDLRPDKPWAWVYLGDAYRAESKPEEAIENYERALEVDPSNARARNNLANLLSEMGRFEKAIPHYREAIRLDQRNANSRRNLALALTAGGKADEAVREYREVLRIDPQDLPARFNLAELLEGLGEKEAAAEEFRAVLRIEPRFAPARAALEKLEGE